MGYSCIGLHDRPVVLGNEPAFLLRGPRPVHPHRPDSVDIPKTELDSNRIWDRNP